MEKIAVIGFENKAEISERYNSKAAVDFDVDCTSRALNFSYSAVFIKSGADDCVIRAWLTNEHLRIVDDTEALFAEIDFSSVYPSRLKLSVSFWLKSPMKANFLNINSAAV